MDLLDLVQAEFCSCYNQYVEILTPKLQTLTALGGDCLER
jgi:hypothetical protein